MSLIDGLCLHRLSGTRVIVVRRLSLRRELARIAAPEVVVPPRLDHVAGTGPRAACSVCAVIVGNGRPTSRSK
jgi:hypothetical protein